MTTYDCLLRVTLTTVRQLLTLMNNLFDDLFNDALCDLNSSRCCRCFDQRFNRIIFVFIVRDK
ncbi:hypothetical protein D3C72_2503030 [compost metagenome]